jgi:hypothetical protein
LQSIAFIKILSTFIPNYINHLPPFIEVQALRAQSKTFDNAVKTGAKICKPIKTNYMKENLTLKHFLNHCLPPQNRKNL